MKKQAPATQDAAGIDRPVDTGNPASDVVDAVSALHHGPALDHDRAVASASGEESFDEDADDAGHRHDSTEDHHHYLSPNTTIDESLILSDEEMEDRVFDDEEEDTAKNFYVSTSPPRGSNDSDDAAFGKPPPTKLWTGQVKKNHANPGNAAASALFVDDKPWRIGPAKAPPKSPNRKDAHQSRSNSSSPGERLKHQNRYASQQQQQPRQIMSYIRNLANQHSPRYRNNRRGNEPMPPSTPDLTKIPASAIAMSRKISRQDNKGGGGGESGNFHTGEDSGDEDGSKSSISSEMISYSSFGSMDDSDGEELELPFEDYVNHPELVPGFWNQLPFVPNHFVNSTSTTGPGACDKIMVESIDEEPIPQQRRSQSASFNSPSGPFPFLDPQLRQHTAENPNWMMMAQLSQRNKYFFVLDHRFFLRALCQLLAERDEVGVEDSIHHAHNIIKRGSLKKKYMGLLKVKYVELRKGNLVYYGDGEAQARKTINLRSGTAVCTAGAKGPGAAATSTSPAAAGGTISALTTSGASSGAMQLSSAIVDVTAAATGANLISGTIAAPGYGFDLWVEGKRYQWIASSEDEQQSWVRAIQQAMIGGDHIDDDDWGMTRTMMSSALISSSDDPWSPHREALDAYLSIQKRLTSATTTESYLNTISPRIRHPLASEQPKTGIPPALHVPLKWVRDQFRKDTADARKSGASPQKRLRTSIIEFWKNMGQYDFAINRHMIQRESPYAAERTIGSLARCILDYDKSFSGIDISESKNRFGDDMISELQAVSYARKILIMILKSKTSGDIDLAVRSMCHNKNIVKIERAASLSSSLETLHIDVAFAGDEVVDHYDDTHNCDEVSGWIKVRRSKYNSWKNRFCLFSTEGVFSYYEHDKPRPHGLRGQLALGGAKLTVVEDDKDKSREDMGLYILRLSTKGQERERQFAFENEEEFLEWKSSIQRIVDFSSNDVLEGEVAATSRDSKKTIGIIEGGSKLISYATDETKKAIKGATGGGIKVIKGATAGGTKVIKGATGGGIKVIKDASGLMMRTFMKGGQKGDSPRRLKKSSSLQMLMDSTRTETTGKREASVQCVAQSTTEFRICPANNSTVEMPNPRDNVITVRVKFLQAYLLSGGASGRLVRGDAMIDLEFLEEVREERR